MQEKKDRRVQKTRKALQTTFEKMVIQEGFDHISVTEIAKQADVGRKTFYLHYLDKFDLLDKIIGDYLTELESICDHQQEIGMVEATRIWFAFFEANRSFFQKILTSSGLYTFRNRFLDFTINQIEKKKSRLTMSADAIDIRFLSYGVTGIIESYILQTFKEEADLLSTRVANLVHRNL